MGKQQGFTLVEVMITVLVLSILIALAIPSFREMMDRNAVVTAANDLLSSILLTRNESVKQEKNVVIRKNASWSKGYKVFADINGDNKYQSNIEAPLLLEQQTSNPTATITGNGAVAKFIRFTPRGRATLNPGNDFFTISKGNQTRYLCFSPTGRPRIQEGSCS